MILITGASSGIGEACARHFAKDSKTAGLILVARRGARLKKLSEELKGLNRKLEIHCVTLDVRKRADIERWAQTKTKLLKRVSILINNAGLAKGLTSLQDGSPEDWDAMIDTNLKGLLYVTHAVLPYFLAKGAGHIVNLGSVAGHLVYPKGNVYCASKFAVRALNDALRLDLAGSGIRVTLVSPGMVNTEFSTVRLGNSKKADAVYAGMTPLSADDIAETVLWCVRRPAHVNIQDVVLYPTDQAAPTIVSRHNT